MEQLIRITTDPQGASVVSARELHGFLEVKDRFVDWFNRRINKYGLVEGQDYVTMSFSGKTEKGGRPETNYALTLDCAKELSMVQNNAKGKQARQYFIDCEKQLRQLTALPSPTDQLLQQIVSQQGALLAVLGQQSGALASLDSRLSLLEGQHTEPVPAIGGQKGDYTDEFMLINRCFAMPRSVYNSALLMDQYDLLGAIKDKVGDFTMRPKRLMVAMKLLGFPYAEASHYAPGKKTKAGFWVVKK